MNWLGWRWFDDSNKSIADKIGIAIEKYRMKFAQVPDVCYVCPSQMPREKLRVGPVRVEPSENLNPNNFWLGMEHKLNVKSVMPVAGGKADNAK